MSNQIWQKRFEHIRKLEDSLQGHIYLAKDLQNANTKVVVKETYKTCVESGESRDGHTIHEDFHTETKLLTHLSKQRNADDGFCRIISEWESEDCYYYAMQYCEAPLFKHVSDAFSEDGIMYDYIDKHESKRQTLCDNNDSHPWLTDVRNIFRQLVKCVYWMHTKGVCHLDLSLENTMLYKLEGLKAKIIDFGLAKQFDESDGFTHDQRVGKRGYMAPEVYRKQTYDARKADVWSLGVILFKMLIGAPPYKRPIKRDAAFEYIINGKLEEAIRHWRRLRLISKDALDCMQRIFEWESERITMEELVCHPFVGLGHLIEEFKNNSVEIECSDREVSDIVSDTNHDIIVSKSEELVLFGDFGESNAETKANVKDILSFCIVQKLMENMENNAVLSDKSVMVWNEKIYNKNVIDDAHRMTVQIMDKIYIYFAYVHFCNVLVYIFGKDVSKGKATIVLNVWQFI